MHYKKVVMVFKHRGTTHHQYNIEIDAITCIKWKWSWCLGTGEPLRSQAWDEESNSNWPKLIDVRCYIGVACGDCCMQTRTQATAIILNCCI